MNVMGMFDLSDRAAIVTGATGQRGYQLSAALLEAKANVVLADKVAIPEEKLKNLKDAGPEIMIVKMDVRGCPAIAFGAKNFASFWI